MGDWSFDITRQAGFDVWTGVCVLASLVLLCYAVVARPLRRRAGWATLGLVAVGVGGTVVVLAGPVAERARVGMIWTFLLLCILSATFYLQLLERLGLPRVAALLTLRVMALLALVPMLFEPVFRFERRPPPERAVLFVVDASGSMSFPDVQNGPTRLQSVWQAIQPVLPKVNEHLVPRYFTFSTDLAELKKPDDLASAKADGKATDIAAAVKRAVAEAGGREDAAVVLLSDGIDNASPDVSGVIAALGRRVYTVAVGSEAAEAATLANVAVADVEASDDFAVGHESTLTATVRSTALNDRVVDVKMAQIDAAGKAVGTPVVKQLVLRASPQGQAVKLEYKPTTVGVHRLAVWVDPVAGERSLVDNRQEFQGLAIDPRVKVLYVEGRVRPEFAPLRHLLERDPNVEVAILLRLTQTRFTASGTVDGKPMPPRVPQSAEEWRPFDVVILGDLDASFLSQPQQAAIERRTADGGGLLMIGGGNSFGPGGYKGSPIERALPVFVGELSSPQATDKFVPQLTPEGARHPSMEGLLPWFGTAERPPERQLPPLNGNVVVGAEKSGAEVLLIHPGQRGPDGRPGIVLATQLYGKGRSAALTVHSTFLWSLPLHGLGQDSPYNRLWGQLVRWLAGADVRNRQRGPGVEGLLNKSVYPLGENVRVRAMVRDARGDATEYAQVSLRLKRADAPPAEEQTFTLNPVASTRGMYDLVIPHPGKGEYVATLTGAKDGKELGRQELKFSVIPPADELVKIAANPGLMRSIAAETRGASYELGRLGDLIDELIRTDTARPKAQQVTVRLANFFQAAPAVFGRHLEWDRKYDLPMQALLVVPLLAIEWILRRRWQLT